MWAKILQLMDYSLNGIIWEHITKMIDIIGLVLIKHFTQSHYNMGVIKLKAYEIIIIDDVSANSNMWLN